MTGKEWKKKEIHQLWNLTGIGIEQRGLFTKHPMDGNGASPAVVPTPLTGPNQVTLKLKLARRTM